MKAIRWLVLAMVASVIGVLAATGDHVNPATAASATVDVSPAKNVTNTGNASGNGYYERDPQLLEASSGTWYLIYSRSQTTFTAGGNPDDLKYDIYHQTSTDNGATWSAAAKVLDAAAISANASFRSATITEADGKIWVIGANIESLEGDIYATTYSGGSWSAQSMIFDGTYQTGAFHVDAIAEGDDIRLFYGIENESKGIGFIKYHGSTDTWDGSVTQIGASAGYQIPRVIKSGSTYHLVSTDWSSVLYTSTTTPDNTPWPAASSITSAPSGGGSSDPSILMYGAGGGTDDLIVFHSPWYSDGSQPVEYVYSTDGGSSWSSPSTPFTDAAHDGQMSWDMMSRAYMKDPNTVMAFFGMEQRGVDRGQGDIVVSEWDISSTIGNAHYTTIQDAVANASSGDTISVAPGTYTEAGQIVISKSLTITGDPANKPVIKPAQDTAASGDSRGWFLVNSGVTFNLNNVVLDGAGHKIWQAIRSHGSGTVESNTFQNILYEPSGPAYQGTGIVFDTASMTVRDNSFTNIGRIGMFVFGSGVTAGVISGNTYTGKEAGDWLDYGVEVGGGAHATVTRNTISGNTGVAKDGSISAGVLVTTFFAPGTQATITENFISGSTIGVVVGARASDTSVATVFNNSLTANTKGVKSTAPLVDASANWWGTQTPVGVAGQVSANVDYTPWLDSSTDKEPATPGFQGDFSTLNVDDDSPQTGATGRIQEGVNLVTGSTVNVAAGTYDEQVVIGKSLTLQGAGDSTVVLPSSDAKLTTVLDGHWGGGLKQIAGIIVANVPSGSNVTVKNLKVDGGGVTAKPTGADYVAGIFYRETGGTIDTVNVTNMTVGTSGTAVRGYGIYLSAGTNTASAEVKGSTITNYDKNGIETAGTTLTVTIHHNTVTGRGPLPDGDEVQNGIVVADGAVGTVNSNTVSNNFYLPETWWGAGIMFIDSGGTSSAASNPLTNNQIGVVFQDGNGSASGNTVSGGKVGLYAQATKAGTWTASFTGNTVGGSDTVGIGGATYHSAASLAITIGDNSLTGGTGDGVAIGDAPEYGPAGSVAATITGNTISGWHNGVYLASPVAGTTFVSADVGPDNNISAPIADASNSGLHAMGTVNLNVHDNTFTGGYDAIKLRLSVTGTVKENVVSGYAKNGITVGKAADDNTGTNVTVSGNSVTGGGAGQVNAQNGIQVGPNAVARIQNNSVSNHVYTLGTGACAGPGTNDDKAYYDACYTAAGIMVYQGTATVTGNAITANQVGVDDSGAEIHNNLIWGNVIYGVNNVSAGVADAENNWWGSCSGPYHPTANPSGTGDAVSDNVDFTPWTTGPCDTDGDGLADDQESQVIGTDPRNPDTDGDGCRDGREYLLMPGFNPRASYWYDFYDVPVPVRPDIQPNGPRNQAINFQDVLAVLAYVGTYDGDAGAPNLQGVSYDSLKDGDWNGDTVVDAGDKVGRRFDRSPSPPPNPPNDAGPPSGAVNFQDMLVVLGQVGLDCSGPP